MLTFSHAYQWVGLAGLIIAAAMGLVYGRREGRVVSAAMVAAWFGSPLVFQGKIQGVEVGLALVDGALLSVLLWVALRSAMWWPMVAAAMLGLIMSLHLAATIDPRIWGRALYIAEEVFSYGALGSLAIGSLVEGRRDTLGGVANKSGAGGRSGRVEKQKAATGPAPAPPFEASLARRPQAKSDAERETV